MISKKKKRDLKQSKICLHACCGRSEGYNFFKRDEDHIGVSFGTSTKRGSLRTMLERASRDDFAISYGIMIDIGGAGPRRALSRWRRSTRSGRSSVALRYQWLDGSKALQATVSAHSIVMSYDLNGSERGHV